MIKKKNAAPKCVAMTRKATPCSFKAVINGRCKRHATPDAVGAPDAVVAPDAPDAVVARVAVVAPDAPDAPVAPVAPEAGRISGGRGLYGSALDEDERAVWASIPVGDLNDEIKLLKVQVARALNEKNPAGLNRALQTLATLERTRMALAQDQDPADEEQIKPKDRAQRLLELVKSASANRSA